MIGEDHPIKRGVMQFIQDKEKEYNIQYTESLQNPGLLICTIKEKPVNKKLPTNALYSTPHTLFTPPLNNEARHVQYIRIFDPVENMGNFSMQYDDQSWQTDYYPYANYTLSMYYQPPSTNYHVPATGETQENGNEENDNYPYEPYNGSNRPI